MRAIVQALAVASLISRDINRRSRNRSQQHRHKRRRVGALQMTASTILSDQVHDLSAHSCGPRRDFECCLCGPPLVSSAVQALVIVARSSSSSSVLAGRRFLLSRSYIASALTFALCSSPVSPALFQIAKLCTVVQDIMMICNKRPCIADCGNKRHGGRLARTKRRIICLQFWRSIRTCLCRRCELVLLESMSSLSAVI